MSGSENVLNERLPNGGQEEGKAGLPSKGFFECQQQKPRGGMSTWQGYWTIRKMDDRQVELVVCAGGWGFYTVVGRYVNGHYLCIPGWKVGCDLSDLCDTYWNYGSISRCLKPFEARSVTTALADFSMKTGWGKR